MLIGIISDTHDHARQLLKAVEVFNAKGVELVIHCGDWVSPFMPDFCKDLNCKLISVFGNNEGDTYRFLKRNQEKKWGIEFHGKEVELEIDGKKIFACHGDSRQLTKALVASQEYDVVFTGHTHEPIIHREGKTLHINPGTVSDQVRSELEHKRTVAIYDTQSDQAELIELKV